MVSRGFPFRGGSVMRLADFGGFGLFGTHSAHPCNRSNHDQPSKYNSRRQDLSGESPAKSQGDERINEGMS